jgi:hypothetical protein
MTMDWSLLKDDETHEDMMAEAITRAVLPMASGEHISVVRGALCVAVFRVLDDAMANRTALELHGELYQIAGNLMSLADAAARRRKG